MQRISNRLYLIGTATFLFGVYLILQYLPADGKGIIGILLIVGGSVLCGFARVLELLDQISYQEGL
jgi:hypothetical protein